MISIVVVCPPERIASYRAYLIGELFVWMKKIEGYTIVLRNTTLPPNNKDDVSVNSLTANCQSIFRALLLHSYGIMD